MQYKTIVHVVQAEKQDQQQDLVKRELTEQEQDSITDKILKDSNMFLINLDRRPDRLEVTMRELYKSNFKNVYRFSAIDSKNNWDNLKGLVDDSAKKEIYNGYRTEHHHLSIGSVGCYLSHLKLWEMLVKSDHKYFTIFEDDTLPSMTQQVVLDKIKQVPDDWDFIIFGGIYDDDDQVISRHICKIFRFYCLHAYMISKRGAKKLLDTALPIKQQIDSWLSDLSEEGQLNIYGFRNSNWNQNQAPDISKTDVQTAMKPSVKYRL